MPSCANKSANNPLDIDTKIIPLEQFRIVFGDIKSYGKHPLISTGTMPSYPMVSCGKEIK
jgi:hypothetical protein